MITAHGLSYKLPSRTETERRTLAGRFLFGADDVHKHAGALSGGERLRAGLLRLLCADQAPELLLLDEPNNHLDLKSLAQLVSALQSYRGALIVVSHDERFLDEIGVTRTLALG